MKTERLNIDHYLMRIKYTGRLDPGLELLQNLQKAHLYSIPFENLDIHYDRQIVLDIGHIYEKVIVNQRGGFCYELNGLFFCLLKQLGFKVRRISAQVHSKEKGFGPPFDHLAILTEIDGKAYLTDVGFGEFTFSPLLFECNLEQQDQFGVFIISKLDSDYYNISKRVDGEDIPQYKFTVEPQELKHFESMCHYQQTDPNSHFTKGKLITQAIKNGRITLTDKAFKRTLNGHKQETKIESKAHFEQMLEDHFNIRIAT